MGLAICSTACAPQPKPAESRRVRTQITQKQLIFADFIGLNQRLSIQIIKICVLFLTHLKYQLS
ncbi:MAG TPA: hypothetical protein PL105_21285, partial [Caldilineaceae bacterium]|nr:hypothetical protein [Caldilineaceae bacterium]